MGASGFLIRRGDAVLLTAPFFSNPGLVRVGLGLPIRADANRIARGLASIEPQLARVESILVGHSHYDHLMDLPSVARTIAELGGRRPTIYASRTAAHILAGFPDLAADVVVVNPGAGSWRRVGRWLPVDAPRPRFRFMALHSEHEPHFLGLKFFGGKLTRDRTKPPRNAWGWREGQTFAWLIDVRGPDGRYDFRLHYQDSSSSPPWGFPPVFAAADERPYDVAVLCSGGFDQVKDYPQAILRDLRPRHVILGHWESFFRSQQRALRPVPTLDTEELVTRIGSALPEGSAWTTPEPGAVLRFCPGTGGGWDAQGSPQERTCRGASGP